MFLFLFCTHIQVVSQLILYWLVPRTYTPHIHRPTNVSGVPRSLQSLVSTIQLVALTADVFIFFCLTRIFSPNPYVRPSYLVPGTYAFCLPAYVRVTCARRVGCTKLALCPAFSNNCSSSSVSTTEPRAYTYVPGTYQVTRWLMFSHTTVINIVISS